MIASKAHARVGTLGTAKDKRDCSFVRVLRVGHQFFQKLKPSLVVRALKAAHFWPVNVEQAFERKKLIVSQTYCDFYFSAHASFR